LLKGKSGIEVGGETTGSPGRSPRDLGRRGGESKQRVGLGCSPGKS
jgi:hypothetical protein